MTDIISELKKHIDESPYEILNLTVYSKGKAETLEYVPSNYCQNVYSVAKFFTMTAIGILYDEGKIRLEDKVCDILSDELPDKSEMDSRWFDCTVEMALTHKLGLPGGHLDIDCNPSINFTDNYLSYTFKTPLEYNPGEGRKYSDGAFYLLSCIVEKITGMKLDDYLRSKILSKMQFQEMAWSHCPKGHAMGATGLYINSADMIKIGVLYLNKGIHNGERLLSEEWIDLAINKGFETEWDDSHTFYFKGGMHGQKIAVSPELDAVIGIESYGADTGDIIRKATELLKTK